MDGTHAQAPSPARRPTLRDVAAAAGVTVSTVSRVLREERAGEFRPETRRAVAEAAAALGYRANPQARGLRLRRHGAVALVVADFDNFGFTEVTRGAQRVLAAEGTTLLVTEGGAGDLEHLADRVDGALVAVAHVGDVLPRALPTVLVQRGAPGVPSVVMAEEEAAAAMARHLLALGHTRVAHVAGDLGTDTGRRRLAGVERALAAASVPLPPGRVADGAFTREGGRAAAAGLVARGAAGAGPPTALAVANLLSALGALEALAAAGLRVPEDVSVVCVDEHLVAAHADPPLTTVRMPQRRLGEAAARALLDVLAGREVGRIEVGDPPEVVPRRSTAPPRTDRTEPTRPQPPSKETA